MEKIADQQKIIDLGTKEGSMLKSIIKATEIDQEFSMLEERQKMTQELLSSTKDSNLINNISKPKSLPLNTC